MKFLKSIDYFGIDLNFTYKGSDKYKSWFGLFSTVTFVSLNLFIFIYYSIEMFQKKNPFVIVTEKSVETPKLLNFKQNKAFFAIGLFSEVLQKEFINESIFSIEGLHFISNRSESIGNQFKIIPVKFEKCNNSHTENIHLQNFDKKKLINYFCLSEKSYNELKIIGNYEDNYYNTLNIQLKRCKNKTYCASQSEIDRILQETWLQIFIFDLKIDVTDFKNPTQSKMQYYEKLFSRKDRINSRFYFSQNKIISDKGFLFEDFNEQEFMQLDKIDTGTGNIVNEVFANVQLLNSRKFKVVKRTYITLPIVLAQVGGMFSILQAFYQIVISSLGHILLIQEIINCNYFIERNEKNNFNNNKKNIKINRSENSKKINKSFEITLNNDEGKVNQINIGSIPELLRENIKEKILFKIKIKFLELFKVIYCKRKKKENKKDKILRKVVKDVNNFFEINYLWDKLKEIDLIKSLIFDENQELFLNCKPKYIIEKKKKNKKKKVENNCDKILEVIRKKQDKNFIDKNIIDNQFNIIK